MTTTGTLTVGFLSLIESDSQSNTEPEIRKKSRSNTTARAVALHRDSLQSNHERFEPRLSYSACLQKKGSGGKWKSYWGEVGMNGVLQLKKAQDSKKARKQYKLRDCSVVRVEDTEFALVVEGKTSHMFRTTGPDIDVWVPTLSVRIRIWFRNLLFCVF